LEIISLNVIRKYTNHQQRLHFKTNNSQAILKGYLKNVYNIQKCNLLVLLTALFEDVNTMKFIEQSK